MPSTTGRIYQAGAALTPREQLLLDALGTIRVATANQLARIVSGTEDATARRLTHRHLQRLNRFGLVRRFPNTIRLRRPGPDGYAHVLTASGRAYLGQTDSRQRRSWQPSEQTLKHWLAITNLYAQLATCARRGGPTIREFRAEADAKRHYRDASGRLRILRPDALIRLVTGGLELSWFAEIDLASEDFPTLRRKCQAYRAYELSGIEQKLYGIFPGVIFITPTAVRARSIQQVIDRQPTDARGLFLVTTEADAPAALASAL
jgi:hypothetical protein